MGSNHNASMSGLPGDNTMDFNSLPMTLDGPVVDPSMVAKQCESLRSSMQQQQSLARSDNAVTVAANKSDAGAGLLPTGFGTLTPPGSASAFTEFMNNRDGSQRVVERIKDFLYILTPDGRIVNCSANVKRLTGYDAGFS